MVTDAADADWKEVEMTYEQLGAFLLDPASQAMPSEQLMAMVKNAKLKRSKGGGKVWQRRETAWKCYGCDADDHIAPNCPIRAHRVAAAGKDGAKGKGKNGKLGKGNKGKGKQVGIWTPAGDHSGT